MCSHCWALKRLTGGLLALFRRAITVTVGTAMLLSGLGPGGVGSNGMVIRRRLPSLAWVGAQGWLWWHLVAK